MSKIGIENLERRELMAANILTAVPPTSSAFELENTLISSYSVSGHGGDNHAMPSNLSAASDPQEIALLLPAVQKVREAAARMKLTPEAVDLAFG